MPTKKITVKKIFANHSDKTGKDWVKVIDSSDTSYSVWETHVANQITEGATITVGFEEKNGYKTIKSVIPASFEGSLGDAVDDDPFRDLDSLPSVTKGPEAPSAPSKLEREVGLIVEERMRAMDAAILLAAHGQIEVKAETLAATADMIIAYYRDK